MSNKTTRELLRLGREQLAAQPAGALEAEVLLAHALEVGRAWLYANGEAVTGKDKRAAYLDLLQRRRSGEPVAYLTGTREFWSLPLRVNPDVLIPRPETEWLVETALAFIPPQAEWRIADLGTGSGAIALAIASERLSCEVHATELSPGALAVARQNGAALLPGRVHFHLGSWLEPLEGTFRVIVSNPPYVAADNEHLQEGDCRFEPRLALSPGNVALSAIEHIARAARERLQAGGLLAFEHGYDQAAETRRLLEDLGYQGVESRPDLENRERITFGNRGIR